MFLCKVHQDSLPNLKSSGEDRDRRRRLNAALASWRCKKYSSQRVFFGAKTLSRKTIQENKGFSCFPNVPRNPN